MAQTAVGQEKRRRIAEEFEVYYSTYDPYTQPLLEKMEEIYQRYKDEPSYLLKARMIRMLCEECPIHLFQESPFFFEISSGRRRQTWGGLQSEVGVFLRTKSKDLWLTPYTEEMARDKEDGFMYHGKDNPVGIDHFCLGYDKILEKGFEGMKQDAIEAMEASNNEQKRSFWKAVIETSDALMYLAERFHKEALKRAEQAEEEEKRAHFRKLAEASSRVPAQSPRTFYEALCAIVFCRECIGSLEGIGVSTFGHLDRLLLPYCDTITEEEIKELFHALLTYTNVRFEAHRAYYETSTTMILGGCDRNGKVVFNNITRSILQAVLEGRYVNTKINCRISSDHPKEYFELLARVQTAYIPVIVMQNDDVIIPARVKCGQELEDARLYVSGGCHEVVLANTEVNTRADTWINLPRILLETMKMDGFDSWGDFYERVIVEIKAYLDKVASIKNRYEQDWCKYAPLPLCSATITGCIESGKDLTEGGAKYSSTALSMVGAATLVDSLYSIKHLVWDTKTVTLKGLTELLETDYEGRESFRRQIIRKIPKYGTNDPVLNTFAAKVLKDVAGLSGQKNGRGGDYLPAFYPHELFLKLGECTGATPDGRKKGMPLSRGCSPSEFIEVGNPLDVIKSLGPIDFTDYADSFCAEMTLPGMTPEIGIPVFLALIEGFLKQGGSSIQFNLLDRALLEDAREHPERHGDMIVRVCGYSAAFVHLSDNQQREIIARAIR